MWYNTKYVLYKACIYYDLFVIGRVHNYKTKRYSIFLNN